MLHPFPWLFDECLLLAVVTVCGFVNAVVDDAQGCLSGPYQRILQSFFVVGGEGAEHPVGQLHLGMGLGAHTDLHPGEFLGTHLGDDGLDAVVAAGGAFRPDPEPSGDQGDVIVHDDDPGRGDVKVGGQLQHAAAGQVHVGLGLQEQQLPALVIDLGVQTLEFHPVDLTAQGIRQNVDGPEAGIVTGLFIFTARIAQTDDQPSFVHGYFFNP